MVYTKLLALLLLPYIRMELPGWGKAMKLLSLKKKDIWKDAPTFIIRDKFSDYLMKVDLSDNFERSIFFLGRYLDKALLLTVSALTKEGEAFIDIGASTGVITLLAARKVGNAGKVFSFEPNPDAMKKLREHLTMNKIENVTPFEIGLSDEKDHGCQRVLKVTNENIGYGTFVQLSERRKAFILKEYKCNLTT